MLLEIPVLSIQTAQTRLFHGNHCTGSGALQKCTVCEGEGALGFISDLCLKVCISDHLGMFVRNRQLAHVERAKVSVEKRMQVLEQAVQMYFSGKAQHISARQCQTPYCTYYDSVDHIALLKVQQHQFPRVYRLLLLCDMTLANFIQM